MSDGGLTEFGRAVVAELDRLGVIIDVAHSSEQTVRDVLATTNRPIVISHTGMRGMCDTHRNLRDELMVEVAAAGGLIGIGYWEAATCGQDVEAVVDHIRYAIDLVGIDHVALGSDFDGSVTVPFDSSELSVLTHTMVARGFSEEEIRAVMGGNAVSFLEQHLP